MTTRPPAEIGMTLDEVDTPALIVDLDAFERNLRRLADRIAGTDVRARPHAKTHKCPVIALKQVALGAVVTRAPAMTDLEQDPLLVIETGDWVKVDADNGVVEILKRRREGAG